MGVPRTAENGKRPEKAPMPLRRISDDPQPRRTGPPFPAVVYWVIGLIVGGVVLAAAMCTALVYVHRLETLRGRVDMLEQQVLDVEARMRNYVDERLRTLQLQQVS